MRRPTLVTQLLAINSTLIALTVLATAAAGRLDLGAVAERRQYLVFVAAVLATVLVNGLVLRRRLEPLHAIIETMEHVDLSEGGRRADGRADTEEVARLHAAFNRMIDRLEHERAGRGGRRAAGAGGRAGPPGARPPRRGQPSTHRRAAAPAGHDAGSATGACGRAPRDPGGRHPGHGRTAAPGARTATDGLGRPRARRRPAHRRSTASASKPEWTAGCSSAVTSTASATTSSSSCTAWSRRRCRTPPGTPPPSTSR